MDNLTKKLLANISTENDFIFVKKTDELNNNNNNNEEDSLNLIFNNQDIEFNEKNNTNILTDSMLQEINNMNCQHDCKK
jgi:hypothetical protein